MFEATWQGSIATCREGKGGPVSCWESFRRRWRIWEKHVQQEVAYLIWSSVIVTVYAWLIVWPDFCSSIFILWFVFFGVWRLDWLSTNINTRSHRHREAPKRTPALRKSKQSFLQLDADLGGADPLSPSFFQIGSSQDLSSTFAAAHSEAARMGIAWTRGRTFNIFNMERYGELWHSKRERQDEKMIPVVSAGQIEILTITKREREIGLQIRAC